MKIKDTTARVRKLAFGREDADDPTLLADFAVELTADTFETAEALGANTLDLQGMFNDEGPVHDGLQITGAGLDQQHLVAVMAVDSLAVIRKVVAVPLEAGNWSITITMRLVNPADNMILAMAAGYAEHEVPFRLTETQHSLSFAA